MADNYLEKQYADYQSRKATMKSGMQRKAHQAMWQVAELQIPSTDDVAMQQFYVEVFGGAIDGCGVRFDNGLRLQFIPFTGVNQQFTIRMASHYQYEQLHRRLATMGIVSTDGTIFDVSGNRITIIL